MNASNESMRVSRDVVTDLLPLYFANEASAATRALVDAHFAADPAFARRARAATGALPGLDPPTQDMEMKALHRTRGLLGLRSWLLGGAIFCTLLPLSFHVGDGAPPVFLFQAQPTIAAAAVGLALLVWGAYFVVRQRLAVTRL